MTKRSPFRYFKTSPEIIRLAVMSQMRSSHPAYWPAAVVIDWSDLPAMDRYVESAGLAAMRSGLAEIMPSQENSLLELLLSDAQPNQETEIGEAGK